MKPQQCEECGGSIAMTLGVGLECRVCGAPAPLPRDAGPLSILGLDLGQTQDYTALAGLEMLRGPDHADAARTVHHYAIKSLFRLKRGTPYPEMVAQVQAFVLGTPQCRGATMAVDQTGVGRPVVDMLRVAGMPVLLRPITITAGNTVSEDPADLSFHVPKRELITTLQVVMQQRRLKYPDPRALPEVAVLVKELADYKVKITAAANETFNAREGAHDDLVLAVALAVWVGERAHVGPVKVGMSARGNVARRAPEGVFGTRR